MIQGALLLVDFLGFRGIWQRVPAEELLKKLASIESAAQTALAGDKRFKTLGGGNAVFNIRMLSDTLAISIQYEEQRARPPHQEHYLAHLACTYAAVLAKSFAETPPPLLFRGCIALGEHSFHNNFLLGPAVDQAAEYMNKPDGAFVWLLPNVQQAFRAVRAENRRMIDNFSTEQKIATLRDAVSRGESPYLSGLLADVERGHLERLRWWEEHAQRLPLVIDPYPMPLSGGGILDSAVVNPLVFCRGAADRAQLTAAYEGSFQGDRLEVWLKRQNTLKFLSVANDALAEHERQLESEFPRKD